MKAVRVNKVGKRSGPQEQNPGSAPDSTHRNSDVMLEDSPEDSPGDCHGLFLSGSPKQEFPQRENGGKPEIRAHTGGSRFIRTQIIRKRAKF